MGNRNKAPDSQLSLNFSDSSHDHVMPVRDHKTSFNVVYLSDTLNSRKETQRKEILSMFSDYASKLSW